jgi:hypothetical protein
MTTLRKLNAMLGKEFIYKQKNILVRDFEVAEEGVLIFTNDDAIQLKPGELGVFIESCLPVDQKGGLVVFTQEDKGTLGQLKDILMDNIKQTQNNPAYVKQATVINNNVNTLINMLSLELKVRKGGM